MDRHDSGQTPTVLELFRSRAAGVPDDYKLAVTVEGGGLRGVVSGAMLIAFGQLGLAQHVDCFFGTSSGSINLSYFAAGSNWDALSVYYDHMTNHFVRSSAFSRIFPRVDMDHLRTVMTKKIPLDVERLEKSDMNIQAILTNVDTGTPKIVDMRQQGDRTIDYLLASSWLPVIAGPPLRIGSDRYLDGGIIWANPMYAALQEEFTHILALNTRPEGQRKSSQSALGRRALGRILNGWSAGLGDTYMQARSTWNADKLKFATADEIALGSSRVHAVAPLEHSHAVERLTLDQGKLLSGARAGYAAVCNTFNPQSSAHYFSLTG